MNYFRVQHKGISFSKVKNFNSGDGGDGYTEGLCVSDSPEPGGFGGAWDAMDEDDEVIVLRGEKIARIYDGYRIRPTEEVARFTVAEWQEMLDSGEAYEYEDWS
jgi:hypothetical protein